MESKIVEYNPQLSIKCRTHAERIGACRPCLIMSNPKARRLGPRYKPGQAAISEQSHSLQLFTTLREHRAFSLDWSDEHVTVTRNI